jgi:malonyl-CoA decarboxylase
MTSSNPSFIDRTIKGFRRAWRIASFSRPGIKSGLASNLSDDDADWLRRQIRESLEGLGGEVSARARAAELGEAYLLLDATGRQRFLRILADEYDVDPDRVDACIAARADADDPIARRQAERRLREALVPPRVELLRRFIDLRQGVKFLVDLRGELMALARDDPNLAGFDENVRDLLASWFDVGFLDLKRITWRTSAALLEKLIEYEAVHAIRSWDDLKHRLEADRRCYAFFHPRMPDEPLIFVQVALVSGMADNVQGLLDLQAPMGDPEQSDTAIFYSISNCQPGLAGVSFGSFLIKRVADDLAGDLPNVRTFATLSPLPGFRHWLRERIEAGEPDLLTEPEAAQVARLGDDLESVLSVEGWWRDEAREMILRPVLLRLSARYLLSERQRHRTVDRVAHFHLSNGARVERINWLADTSTKGIAESAGMMVNYCYELADIERNHEAYSGDGQVAAAPFVKRLLKP